ncbi:MAG: uroporphyrinogen decarboxylase family protein, partial [Paracoccaceae bacterium]
TGIGASQVDRNSIPDLDIGKQEIRETAQEFVAAIKRVCKSIDVSEDNYVLQPWPSHVYFEDISAQSQFEMIEIIIQTVRDDGAF